MTIATKMSTTTNQDLQAFHWKPQPEAASLIGETMSSFVADSPFTARFADRLSRETGTRLIDWTDHIALPANDGLNDRLEQVGFVAQDAEPCVSWEHPVGSVSAGPDACAIGPPAGGPRGVGWPISLLLKGSATRRSKAARFKPMRKARVAAENGCEFWAVERHGYRGWDLRDSAGPPADRLVRHAEAFSRRQRVFEDVAARLCRNSQTSCRRRSPSLEGVVRPTCFLRPSGNTGPPATARAASKRAVRTALGLGWANHDHHTYRSSREHFSRLIAILEDLGFQCRERFYAGREAGWGAQVLEQEESQIVIFADVDLSADEVTEDFAHVPLAPSGTSSARSAFGACCMARRFMEAGMHHLECRFDFDAARAQLQHAGFGVMRPLHRSALPQAGLHRGRTLEGRWPPRAAAAVEAGAITAAQAEQFCRDGRVGFASGNPPARRRLQGLQPDGNQRDHPGDRPAELAQSQLWQGVALSRLCMGRESPYLRLGHVSSKKARV